MGTAAYVIVLIVALVLSAQVLLLTARRRPLRHRLRDLGTGGDSFGILLTGLLTLGSAGAVGGSLAGAPAFGAAVGVLLALLIWTTAVVRAHAALDHLHATDDQPGVSKPFWFAALAVLAVRTLVSEGGTAGSRGLRRAGRRWRWPPAGRLPRRRPTRSTPPTRSC